MNQDRINGLICEIDVAWEKTQEWLADIATFNSQVVEANDWLATLLLRVAQLNAEVSAEITTSLR